MYRVLELLPRRERGRKREKATAKAGGGGEGERGREESLGEAPCMDGLAIQDRSPLDRSPSLEPDSL